VYEVDLHDEVNGGWASREDEKQKAHFFLFGLAGHPEKDLSKMCPNGIDWVQLKGNVGDMILSGITLGIWQPRTIGVKCAQGDGGEQ
jgi:hypothetical protein